PFGALPTPGAVAATAPLPVMNWITPFGDDVGTGAADTLVPRAGGANGPSAGGPAGPMWTTSAPQPATAATTLLTAIARAIALIRGMAGSPPPPAFRVAWPHPGTQTHRCLPYDSGAPRGARASGVAPVPADQGSRRGRSGRSSAGGAGHSRISAPTVSAA